MPRENKSAPPDLGHGIRRLPTMADAVGESENLATCIREGWCPQPTACWSARGGRIACVSSECDPVGITCPEGEGCRLVSTAGRVFRCVPAGSVPLGGTCSDVFPAPIGLTCDGRYGCWHGRCRARCTLGADCGAGERCVRKSRLEQVCADDICDSDRDCKLGRPVCLDLKDSGLRSCFAVAPGSCRPGRCPDGQGCEGLLKDGRVVGRCRPICDPVDATACGPDGICGAPSGDVAGDTENPKGFCHQRCSFSKPGRCGAGESCSTLGGDATRLGCTIVPSVR